MRSLVIVLVNILRYIPEEERELISKLNSIRESAMYSAPEMMGLHWNRTHKIICDNMWDEITNDITVKHYWQLEVLSIFSTRSIDELEKALNIQIKD